MMFTCVLVVCELQIVFLSGTHNHKLGTPFWQQQHHVLFHDNLCQICEHMSLNIDYMEISLVDNCADDAWNCYCSKKSSCTQHTSVWYTLFHAVPLQPNQSTHTHISHMWTSFFVDRYHVSHDKTDQLFFAFCHPSLVVTVLYLQQKVCHKHVDIHTHKHEAHSASSRDTHFREDGGKEGRLRFGHTL